MMEEGLGGLSVLPEQDKAGPLLGRSSGPAVSNVWKYMCAVTFALSLYDPDLTVQKAEATDR